MTARMVALPITRGAREYRELYQKYASIALGIAIVLHALIIGGYYLAQLLGAEEEQVLVLHGFKHYIDIGPPPSISNAEAMPQVSVSLPAMKPTFGIPVPVPDATVSPDKTIASQNEPQPVLPTTLDGTGNGSVVIQEGAKLEDEVPPDTFVAVEKLPVPVREVQPGYPEIARRTNTEGVVWVKILVDKEGRAKRVKIEKSASELLDEPALEAAKQWLFTPAMMNNGPVAVWVAIPFKFKLNR